MKPIKIITALIFILTISQSTIGQEEDSLNFFPLHEGDLWQYINVPTNEFSEIKVMNVDTLFSDSSIVYTIGPGTELNYKIYFNDKHTIYWDIDTGWSVAYKFDVPVNSNWLSQPSLPSWRVYKREFKDLYYLFEDSIDAREYWDVPDTNSTLATSVKRLAKGIGFYYSEFEGGIIYLTGCIVNGVQYGTIVNVDEETDIIIPDEIEVKSYPNPFNSQANIVYSLPYESNVIIKIYNTLGEEVELLYYGVKVRGEHLQVWNAYNKPSGIYYAVLHADNQIKTIKLLYLK